MVSRTLVLYFLLPAILCVGHAAAQNDATRADGAAMSRVLSENTGIPTVVTLHPSIESGYDYDYDIRIVFMSDVTNYQGVMGAVIGAVGESTRSSAYKTHYCYIQSPNRETERIKTTSIRKAQTLALAGNYEEAWDVFVWNKETVKTP